MACKHLDVKTNSHSATVAGLLSLIKFRSQISNFYSWFEKLWHWERLFNLSRLEEQQGKKRELNTRSESFFIVIFFNTESETIHRMEKFWNREVSKPKRHTLIRDLRIEIFKTDLTWPIRGLALHHYFCGVIKEAVQDLPSSQPRKLNSSQIQGERFSHQDTADLVTDHLENWRCTGLKAGGFQYNKGKNQTNSAV